MIVAELSCSHKGSLYNARALMKAAKDAGADAVKLQTFTPGSMTLDCDAPEFIIQDGLWKGRKLFDLYAEAATPLDWHAELFALAAQLGLICFSSPFDPNAVNFLEDLDCPIYKIASFELNDLPLIERCAKTGKPLIMSTGMSSYGEVAAAIRCARAHGADDITLLHCVSAYPTPIERANLNRIKLLNTEHGYPTGLSDHSLSTMIPAIAVALGAVVVEKHLKLAGDSTSLDAAFALNPREFEEMVTAIETAKAAMEVTEPLEPYRELRRSLYAIKDIPAGTPFTLENIKSIRPGNGLEPAKMDVVLASKAAVSIQRGTPLAMAHLA